MRQGSRWDAGAAPATVSGEIAAWSHWEAFPGKVSAIDDPEPGDLLDARLQPTILGRRTSCRNGPCRCRSHAAHPLFLASRWCWVAHARARALTPKPSLRRRALA